MNSTARRRIDSPKELLAILATTLALAVVPQATPASTPLLNLSPITIANGTAVIAGTLGSEAAGDTLTVNGQPLGVDATGHFAGTVDLNGAISLDLTLTSPAGDGQVQYTIPLTAALPGGIIPADVLAQLEQAGVTLLKPVAGADGEPLTVAGSVLDKSQLVTLTLNGTDILGALSSDGSFSLQVPGTTRTIVLKATDTHGVSETHTVAVTHTALRVTSVSAANAVGLRIVSVRYNKKGVLRTHRIRMVVTVKDTRGLLIQGAKISVQSTKAGRLVHSPQGTISGKKGRATFTLRLRKAAFGKRLVTITVAKTPRAKAKKTTSIRVPRARR